MPSFKIVRVTMTIEVADDVQAANVAEAQRVLASTTTAPPIPGSPQMLIVTPGEQAEVTPNPAAVPATAAQRREARNRNRRLQQARQHQGTPTQIPTTVTTPATPATGNR